mmetsp:Transcript_18351/g.50342  ORF Transcript_18351/g.50342 Transcript_18351/m.50342 type:complete len:110 (-) Transcript_18351:23-352(-)
MSSPTRTKIVRTAIKEEKNVVCNRRSEHESKVHCLCRDFSTSSASMFGLVAGRPAADIFSSSVAGVRLLRRLWLCLSFAGSSTEAGLARKLVAMPAHTAQARGEEKDAC